VIVISAGLSDNGANRQGGYARYLKEDHHLDNQRNEKGDRIPAHTCGGDFCKNLRRKEGEGVEGASCPSNQMERH